MQLGLSESLSSLVSRRFVAARDAGHLIFSSTHLATVRTSSIPYQVRYCPALAKKPTGAPKPDKAPSGPKPDPFQDPSPDLLLAQIPRENPSHVLVLNKFPVIPNHFILATKAWQSQTDLLDKEDLEAAYACIKAWAEGSQPEGQGSKKLFAFFNSGDESGASQPHRHLQFLPVEAMAQGDSENWQPLIDAVARQPTSSGTGYQHLAQVPFAHFARPLPPNPSSETLHQIYLSLYRAAVATAKGGLSDAGQVAGPAAIILAGTLMVKAEAEWDELRRNSTSLHNVLAAIGYPQPDAREVSLL
ncbi:bis(5'-nucleosyl)-tetraphosphatase [Aspergillus luchuensis]|uniref:Bis(5'-nucleosyl)-tetraphosphatase n=1 Tax=Aspergillus kawachii TaxID=1069201 RepID=A0A146FTJ8_ASPKA|nr:bis(5'-nucleosyl)-tetraphosphatase [Aspergillus luchuensis]